MAENQVRDQLAVQISLLNPGTGLVSSKSERSLVKLLSQLFVLKMTNQMPPAAGRWKISPPPPDQARAYLTLHPGFVFGAV